MMGMAYLQNLQAATMTERTAPAARSEIVTPNMVVPTRVDEFSALTYSAVYRAIDLISSDIAMLPWRVHERAGESRILRDDHPIDRLLNVQPNSEMTAFHFRKTMQQHALSWGNGYAEIEFDRMGKPMAMWPLLPNMVKPDRTEQGVLVYKWRAEGGEEKVIPADRILHVRGMGFDGLAGYSVIRLAMLTIARGKAAEEFGAGFFAGGGRPAGVLTYPGKVSDEAGERLRRDWQQRYGGTRNAGRIAILEQGMDYKPIGIPPEEAQFIETMKFNIVDVARWFGIPPHKLGELSLTTIGNIEEQERSYAINTLAQWVKVWEEETDWKLLSEDERAGDRLYTRMNLRSRLRADQKSRGDFYAQMFNLGALSVNEIRRNEDMDPIGPEGDVRYIPLNMARLGSEPAQQGEAAPDRRRATQAMRTVMVDAVDTVATKAEKATERARKKHTGEALAEWGTEFFGGLFAEAQRVAMPGVRALCALLGVEADGDAVTLAVRQWAAETCEAWREQAVGDGLAVDRATVAGRLEALVDAAMAVAANGGA